MLNLKHENVILQKTGRLQIGKSEVKYNIDSNQKELRFFSFGHPWLSPLRVASTVLNHHYNASIAEQLEGKMELDLTLSTF